MSDQTTPIEDAAALARRAVAIERAYATALKRGDWLQARLWAAQRIPPEAVYQATRAALGTLEHPNGEPIPVKPSRYWNL